MSGSASFTEATEEFALSSEREVIFWDRELDDARREMDIDIRWAVQSSLAPCTPLEFLTEYMVQHEQKFGAPLEWTRYQAVG